MADKLIICKHNDGLGHCDVFGGEYCVESPCQHEDLADYALVVRCEDCKYQGHDEDCPLLSMLSYTEPDDFCSCGKRKRKEGDGNG